MKYSVIIPSYNHEKYISEAISSALNQSFPPFEVIIVDDGSSDNSVKICEAIAAQDNRVKIITQKNSGAHNAINRGIQNATGDYLAILNSDDVYHAKRFETLFKIPHDKWDLIGSAPTFIDSNSKPIQKTSWLRNALIANRVLGNNILSLSYANYFMTTSNFLIRKPFLDKVGLFENYRYCHDLDFLIRSSVAGKVFFLSEELLYYRFHSSNTVREGVDKVLTEAWIVIFSNFKRLHPIVRIALYIPLMLISLLNRQHKYLRAAEGQNRLERQDSK